MSSEREHSGEESEQSEESMRDLEVPPEAGEDVKAGHTDDDDLDQLVIQR